MVRARGFLICKNLGAHLVNSRPIRIASIAPATWADSQQLAPIFHDIHR